MGKGGYDNLGCYWGVGEPLWWYGSEWVDERGNEISDHIRAISRAHAKEIIIKRHPGATFWR